MTQYNYRLTLTMSDEGSAYLVAGGIAAGLSQLGFEVTLAGTNPEAVAQRGIVKRADGHNLGRWAITPVNIEARVQQLDDTEPPTQGDKS